MYPLTFWALTIGCIIGGFMVSKTWWGAKVSFLNQVQQKLTPFEMWIGIICLAGGVLALFFPLEAQPIVGDLIPAIAAMLIGANLIGKQTQKKFPIISQINDMTKSFEIPLGVLTMVVGVLHWFFLGMTPFF